MSLQIRQDLGDEDIGDIDKVGIEYYVINGGGKPVTNSEVGIKIVYEIIQDPVSENNKTSQQDQLAYPVFGSVCALDVAEGPNEPCQEQIHDGVGVDKHSVREKEIADKVVIDNLWRR